MSQPAWKAELRDQVRRACAEAEGFAYEYLEPHDYQKQAEAAVAVVMPHIEAAFKRGEDAAKLRQGSRPCRGERAPAARAGRREAPSPHRRRCRGASAEARHRLGCDARLRECGVRVASRNRPGGVDVSTHQKPLGRIQRRPFAFLGPGPGLLPSGGLQPQERQAARLVCAGGRHWLRHRPALCGPLPGVPVRGS